jgi:hypothetical protein
LLLRREWRTRYARAPFYSLGLASYLDWHVGACAYTNGALRNENNALLTRHFADVFQGVIDALSEQLGKQARLASDVAAVPGFHVYLPDPAFALPVASIHQDFQHRTVFPGIVPDDTISFTLTLSAPPGSGLNVWRERRSPPMASQPLFHEYRPGEMVIHEGHWAHQAVLSNDGDTPRVTFQGHGVVLGSECLLYW